MKGHAPTGSDQPRWLKFPGPVCWKSEKKQEVFRTYTQCQGQLAILLVRLLRKPLWPWFSEPRAADAAATAHLAMFSNGFDVNLQNERAMCEPASCTIVDAALIAGGVPRPKRIDSRGMRHMECRGPRQLILPRARGLPFANPANEPAHDACPGLW